MDGWKLSRMKQTKDVRMYSEEFILVDLDTLLHKVEVKMHGKMQVYIHSQQRTEKCENCS